MLSPTTAEYADVILQVAARDPSIANVLREICALDAGARSSVLDLVAAHLRVRTTAPDVLECLAMLRQDEVARRVAAGLAAPGPNQTPSA